MMLRAPIPDLAPGERVLTGALHHYLVRVIRLRAGDTFVAFDPVVGNSADARVDYADREWVRIVLGAPRATSATPLRELTWIQGMPKGDKCDAIVRDATELGATQVILALTRRSVVRLDGERTRAKEERWSRIAREAARQCGRSEVPTVEVTASLEAALAPLADGECARFFLYERATEPLAPRLLAALTEETPIAFVAGPEGGFEEEEAHAAGVAGWALASLGPLTLRTETVAAAVLGAVRVFGAL